jgi:hypothetical protein
MGLGRVPGTQSESAPTLDVPSFRRKPESMVVVCHVASADSCRCLLQSRAGSRPGRRPTFLFAQESRQRSAPRLPGPAGCPRCGRPAGPVAKLASLGQRDRTSPATAPPPRRSQIGDNLSPTCSGGGGEAGGWKSALGTLAEIGGELANDRNAAISRTHTFGQKRNFNSMP